MKKTTIAVALMSMIVSGCSTSIPGLTSHTNVPLELKGYRTGMAFTTCPSGAQSTGLRGRRLTCVLDEKSFGGTAVTNAGVVVFDGRIVSIIFKLDRAGGFSQPGVKRSLTEKFGPPARAASHGKAVFWSNRNDQLLLDEIAGEVRLIDFTGLKALHDAEAKAGSRDL